MRRCGGGIGRGAVLAAGTALAALSGCAHIGSSAHPDAALEASTPPEHRSLPESAVPPGKSLKEFYASVEADLVANGRLRRDTAPADAPFTVDDLVRDFERIALKNEYLDVGGRFVHTENPALLRRWEGPVRVAVMTAPPDTPADAEDAARDRANVAGFTSRLAQLTGLDMAVGSGADVNFLILFMSSEQRAAFAQQVSAFYPDFAPAVVSMLRDTELDNFCTTYSFFRPDAPSVYSAVIVMIRAEHPPLTRLSCVNEEMSQAMGLVNDSPDARPSLFNNTFEFALLTDHDAILLRMLYDPRLRPGMTADEVRPLLPDIARDAMAAQGGEMRVASLP